MRGGGVPWPFSGSVREGLQLFVAGEAQLSVTPMSPSIPPGK
jgi:hypothetical protein